MTRFLQPRRLQINVKIHCRFFCAGINLNNWTQLLRETHNKGPRIDLNKPFRNCHRQAGPIDTVQSQVRSRCKCKIKTLKACRLKLVKIITYY